MSDNHCVMTINNNADVRELVVGSQGLHNSMPPVGGVPAENGPDPAGMNNMQGQSATLFQEVTLAIN